MKILIAGGSGYIGKALHQLLSQEGYNVSTLTRQTSRQAYQIQWDGKTIRGWGHVMNEVDAVVNATGFSLDHWPWTKRRKQRFVDSRVLPGRALVSAIQAASHRPQVLLQISGINHYGLRGDSVADESTPAGDDFLAQLTEKLESATQPVEDLGVRHVIARSAVILARNGGLLPRMALPVRVFFGGKFGTGSQAMQWIHLADELRALKYLLENRDARGAYNLIAPSFTSNAEFMCTLAKILHRPFWFHVPKFLLKLALGEMSVLLTEGRYSQPRRLLDEGFKFKFPTIEKALENIYSN